MLHTFDFFAGFGKKKSPLQESPQKRINNYISSNHIVWLGGCSSALEWGPSMPFTWHNYKWKYICGEHMHFSPWYWSCFLSPSAEKSRFVKNKICFPLKTSLLLQLIFYFIKPALGFLLNSLSTHGYGMGEREYDSYYPNPLVVAKDQKEI